MTAQDILDQNAQSVADALRFVPGLFLSVGGTTAPSVASIRGLTARQNVVFIDGRPVYDPFFGDLRMKKLIHSPPDTSLIPNGFRYPIFFSQRG